MYNAFFVVLNKDKIPILICFGIRTERSFSKNFCSQYRGMFDYYTVLKAKDIFFNIKYRQHNANKTFKILQY